MTRQRESFVVGASEPCFFLKPPPKVDTSLRHSVGEDFYLWVGLMEFQWFRRQNDMHFSCLKRESSVGLMEFQWFCGDTHHVYGSSSGGAGSSKWLSFYTLVSQAEAPEVAKRLLASFCNVAKSMEKWILSSSSGGAGSCKMALFLHLS